MHKQLSPFITVSIVRGLQAEVVRQGSALRSQPRGTRHSNLLRRCPKPSISKAPGRDLAVAFAIPDRLISSVFTYFRRRHCWGVGNTWSVVIFSGLFVAWRSGPTHTQICTCTSFLLISDDSDSVLRFPATTLQFWSDPQRSAQWSGSQSRLNSPKMGGLLPFKSSPIKGIEFLIHESDFTNGCSSFWDWEGTLTAPVKAVHLIQLQFNSLIGKKDHKWDLLKQFLAQTGSLGRTYCLLPFSLLWKRIRTPLVSQVIYKSSRSVL